MPGFLPFLPYKSLQIIKFYNQFLRSLNSNCDLLLIDNPKDELEFTLVSYESISALISKLRERFLCRLYCSSSLTILISSLHSCSINRPISLEISDTLLSISSRGISEGLD